MSRQERLFQVEQRTLTTDDWYTPPHIFDALGLTFDLDVASPPGGPLFVPTKHYFTQYDDALGQEWFGRVWMNPPYSNPLPWVQRFIEHGNGVALLPTSNGRWFRILWDAPTTWKPIASIKFYKDDGEAKNTMPNIVWLIGIGDECRGAVNVAAIKNASETGR